MVFEALAREVASPTSEREPKTKQSMRSFQFADTDAIKKKVRHAQLGHRQYDVADFYYDDGFFRRLATNKTFENFTLGVIVANALWMSYDTDRNDAKSILDAKPIFVAADVLFFTYFFMEVSVRFMAFKYKSNCLKDNWFKFDSCLVILYAFDPFVIGIMIASTGSETPSLPTAILRLFRLGRLSRLVRMLRAFPQLMTMIKGMITATASVSYVLGLLLLMTFVFAIALRNLVPEEAEIEDKYFPDVLQAMITLIIFGTFLDALSDFMLAIQEQSTSCFILCWVYIGFASLTVMNMLVGVLCEVISAVAAEENESMNVQIINEKFERLADDNHTPGSLNWSEFQQIVDDPDSTRAFKDVGVDPEGMIELSQDFFFVDGTENIVSIEEFMEMVLDARGGLQTTVNDIMHLGKRFNQKFVGLKMRMDGMDSKLDELLKKRRNRSSRK